MPFEDELIEVVTPERVGLNFPIAGLGSRFAAAIIDAFILFLTYIAVELIFAFFLRFFDASNDYFFSISIGIYVIISFCIFFGYFIFYECRYNGQTFGKRVMRIRAIRLNGLPVDFTSSTIRSLIRPIDLLLCSFAVGFLVIFLSKLNQRPGDFVAGTVVIHDQTVTLKDLDKYVRTENKDKPPLRSELRLRKLTDEDVQLIELFMERRRDMDLESRRRFAKQIAGNIRRKLEMDPKEYGGNENLIRTIRESLKNREKGNW